MMMMRMMRPAIIAYATQVAQVKTSPSVTIRPDNRTPSPRHKYVPAAHKTRSSHRSGMRPAHEFVNREGCRPSHNACNQQTPLWRHQVKQRTRDTAAHERNRGEPCAHLHDQKHEEINGCQKHHADLHYVRNR